MEQQPLDTPSSVAPPQAEWVPVTIGTNRQLKHGASVPNFPVSPKINHNTPKHNESNTIPLSLPPFAKGPLPELPPITDVSVSLSFETSGISSIKNNFTSKTIQLADENTALKTQLNGLLRDNGELWEQKLNLAKQVSQLSTENKQLVQLVDTLQTDLQLTEEAKQALEKRSYTLNDLLDVATESQLILKSETETLINDLSKCRVQKSTLLDQLSSTLKEVSILGSEVSQVKEKNYNLLQQLATITSPSPLEVVKSLMNDNANSTPSYFLVHQFRRLKQKKQLLEAAMNVPDPTILKDIVITLRVGLTDDTFANLLAPYPEAKNLYISHMMSLGLSAWPDLLIMLAHFSI